LTVWQADGMMKVRQRAGRKAKAAPGWRALRARLRCDVTTKEQMKAVIEAQPDDATYDEILRELALGRMVDRGLADSREGRAISNEEMGERVRQWRR
jgi:hypothetical protein